MVLYRVFVTSLWILSLTSTTLQAPNCTYTFIFPDLINGVLTPELNTNLSLDFGLERSPENCIPTDMITITVGKKRDTQVLKPMCKIVLIQGVCVKSVGQEMCKCLPEKGWGWYQLSKHIEENDYTTWVWQTDDDDSNKVNITMTKPTTTASLPEDSSAKEKSRATEIWNTQIYIPVFGVGFVVAAFVALGVCAYYRLCKRSHDLKTGSFQNVSNLVEGAVEGAEHTAPAANNTQCQSSLRREVSSRNERRTDVQIYCDAPSAHMYWEPEVEPATEEPAERKAQFQSSLRRNLSTRTGRHADTQAYCDAPSSQLYWEIEDESDGKEPPESNTQCQSSVMRRASSLPGRHTERHGLDPSPAPLYWELEEDPYTEGELAKEDEGVMVVMNCRGQKPVEEDYGYSRITTPRQKVKPDYKPRPPVPTPRQAKRRLAGKGASLPSPARMKHMETLRKSSRKCAAYREYVTANEMAQSNRRN